MSKPVLRLGGGPEDIDGEEVVVGGEENFTRLQVATAVTLGVGIIQVNYNCRSTIDLKVTDSHKPVTEFLHLSLKMIKSMTPLLYAFHSY